MDKTPTWQENLARIRQELAPGFQDVLDKAISKIELEAADLREQLATARRKERERCAKVCNALNHKDTPNAMWAARQDCVAAIRALSNDEQIEKAQAADDTERYRRFNTKWP